MALHHFQETFGKNVGAAGDVFVLAGAEVTVKDEATGTLVAIYQDVDGNAIKANPFNADGNGFAEFYVKSGRIRVTATASGQTVDLRNISLGSSTPVTTGSGADQDLGAALDQRVIYVDTIADMDASTSFTVGQAVRTLGYYTPGDGGGADYEIVAAGTGSNYGFLYEQLTASGHEAKLIGGGIMEDKTAFIPTDYASLQEAIDDLSKLHVTQGVTIDLMIETGHQPNSGVILESGDYSHLQISSVDAEVTLDPMFPATDIIKGKNARMPTLNCLINANSLGANGYFADQGSSGFVTSGSGIKFCNRQACYANAGSSISADSTVWTNASQEAAAYSGILAWASQISAQAADVSNSNYYGAQAAAGGSLNFRDGVADGSFRHGVRATNMAIVNARGASSQNTGATGFRAFDSGVIHATSSNASGSLGNAYLAENNGIITCDSATADAALSVLAALKGGKITSTSLTSTAGSIRAEDGSEVTLVAPTITATGTRPLNASWGSKIVVNGGEVSGGDGNRSINVIDGSSVICTGTDLTANSTEAQLAVVGNGSELAIYGGTHSFPNDSVNLSGGSLLRLHGSGILASTVPGMVNASLVSRGIMWGAS